MPQARSRFAESWRPGSRAVGSASRAVGGRRRPRGAAWRRGWRAATVGAAGFSLIEVIVALVVFGVGILGVMGTFSLSLQTVSRTTRLDEAVTIAERELERAILSFGQSQPPAEGAAGQFTWKVELAERPAGLVLATIEVRWSVRGDPRTYRLSRIFAPPPEES